MPGSAEVLAEHEIQTRLIKAGLPRELAREHATRAARLVQFTGAGVPFVHLEVEGPSAFDAVAQQVVDSIEAGKKSTVDALILANRRRSKAPNALTKGR